MALRFSQDFIQKVLESNSIIEYISQFTELKQKGDRFTGLCPFPDHNEKSPSFSISENKQLYYCFGCEKSGNLYTIVQALQGLIFPEAVEFLAGKAGIPIPEEERAQSKREREFGGQKSTMWEINDLARQFYHKQLCSLPQTHSVWGYIKKRGMNESIVKEFNLGVALDEWEGLVQFLEQKKVSIKIAEEMGLIRKRKAPASGHYDLFRNRLIFPIISQQGRAVGFGGRVFGEELPKYLNSPESDVFSKGRLFYGLYETAKFIRSADQAIVVEGYMDLIALYSAGIKNVVATLGTALTPDHAHLMKRFTKNVVVLFDGDSAGQRAAERSLPILLGGGLIPKCCILPEGQDPDDFIVSQGGEALQKSINDSKEMFLWFMSNVMDSYRGGVGEKVTIMDKVRPIFDYIKDANLKSLYAGELADWLGVKETWVITNLKGRNKPLQASVSPGIQHSVTHGKGTAVERDKELGSKPLESSQQSQEKISLKGASKIELSLLSMGLIKLEYYQLIVASGVIKLIQHQGLREIFQRIEDLYRQEPSGFDKLGAILINQVTPASVITGHLEAPWVDLSDDGLRKTLGGCIKRVKAQNFKTQARNLQVTLKGKDPAEQKKHLERIMDIHKSRQNLMTDK